MAGVQAEIREIDGVDVDGAFAQVASETSPAVIRGLVADWPLIDKAHASSAATVKYLLEFYNGKPVTTFTAEPAAGGRIAYTENLSETNFEQTLEPLGAVLEKLLDYEQDASAPTMYVGSRALDLYLPGLSEQNALPQGDIKATVRIWIGNQSAVAPHYDVLENIACVCAGRRRFTVFPPDQLENLYIGPIDFTPAGQSISLVDLNDPDFDKYPRFAEALASAQSAVLEPGDAIFIPSMWWHAVEGLDSFNILINHWWRNVPAYMGAPGDALLHAILNIRGLPREQRKAWQAFFEHYVFEADGNTVDHIPADRRGVLGEIDDATARRIRALLRNNLNR